MVLELAWQGCWTRPVRYTLPFPVGPCSLQEAAPTCGWDGPTSFVQVITSAGPDAAA